MHQSETEVSDRSPSKQPFQKRVGNLFIAQSYSNFSQTAVFHRSFSWCDFSVIHDKKCNKKCYFEPTLIITLFCYS